jgi:hypothetical protein
LSRAAKAIVDRSNRAAVEPFRILGGGAGYDNFLMCLAIGRYPPVKPKMLLFGSAALCAGRLQ